MSKTFVIGDIHGNIKALKQVLERSEFDYEEDTLIQLGDIVDGWGYTYDVVEELLSVVNLITIRGNHDDWFNTWLQTGVHPSGWMQGANKTAESYLRQIDKEDLIEMHKGGGGFITALNPDDIPPLHQKLFREQSNYYVYEQNRLFIHGGFDRHYLLKDQHPSNFYWDRDLWHSALSFEATKKGLVMLDPDIINFKIKENFKEIYIGHTTTQLWNRTDFMQAFDIYNLDCGAGGSGKLCMINVDTKEAFYSDLGKDLYPNEKGRW